MGDKWEKWYIKFNYDSFSMFFIIAFSHYNFYGIQEGKKANSSENVINFLDCIKFQVPQNKDW